MAVMSACVREISVTSPYRYRNTVSVETTQPVHDNFAKATGTADRLRSGDAGAILIDPGRREPEFLSPLAGLRRG